MQHLRAREVCGGNAVAPFSVRVVEDSRRIGVEPSRLDVSAVLIGLAPVEDRRLRLPGATEHSESQHAEGDVRCVLPVMTEGRERIAGRGWTLRKRDRADGGLANGGDV